MKFSDLQKLLQKNLGINHLADIARELGASPQAVSNWKSRDRVPYKYIIKAKKIIEGSSHFKFENPIERKVGHSSNDSSINTVDFHSADQDTVTIADIIIILAKNINTIIIVPSIICSYTIVYALYFTCFDLMNKKPTKLFMLLHF